MDTITELKSPPWEVFISFKDQDAQGRPTEDCLLAEQLHQRLSNKGLRVFLSRVSLQEHGVADYKRAIDQALDQARILIAVGTSVTNLESRWVRYERDSFFNDILSGVKQNGRIFGYIKAIPFHELPRVLRYHQCFKADHEGISRLEDTIASALRESPAAGVCLDDMFLSLSVLKSTSWSAACDYAAKQPVTEHGHWLLPSLEQLKRIRRAALLPASRYWSSARHGGREALYLNFEDGHANSAPVDFNRGIDAVLVARPPTASR